MLLDVNGAGSSSSATAIGGNSFTTDASGVTSSSSGDTPSARNETQMAILDGYEPPTTPNGPRMALKGPRFIEMQQFDAFDRYR